MIISASRRTDIPAFYTEWLIKRLQAGYVSSVNPYNREQVSRVSLRPEDVDVIVFWTKNPAPLLPYLDKIDQMGFRYYFQFTLNGYPQILEPGLPDLETLVGTFQELAAKIGKERVVWRYDPLVFTERTNFNYHRNRFTELLSRLSKSAGRIVVSIADDYQGSLQRLAKLEDRGFATLANPQLEPGYGQLFTEMAKRSAEAGLEIFSCAEPFDLKPYGIKPGKCIDNDYIEQVFGTCVTDKKDKTQRLECGCVASKDIGAYDSCVHDCVYCYATHNRKMAHQNHMAHQSDSPSLLGWYEAPPEKPSKAEKSEKPKKNTDEQFKLF